MAFFENLSKFYKTRPGSANVFHGTSMDFPEIDINEAIAEFNVKEDACKDGKSNIPKTNRNDLSGTEERYKVSFEGDKTYHINNSLEVVSMLEKEALNNKLDNRMATFNNLTKTIKEKFDNIITKGKSELLLIKKRRSEIKNEYEKFRKDNQLERSSIIPRSMVYYNSIIGIIIIFESFLNGYFFAEGNPLGLVGGWFLAFILSLINVFIGYTIGKYILPYKNHVLSSKSSLAFLGYIVFILLILVFNFFVGHLRDISATGVNPTLILIYERLSSPFVFVDIESLLLILVGFIFSISASITGYKSDDPYPGYGSLSKRWEEVVEEYNETSTEIHGDLEGYRDNTIDANSTSSEDIKTRYNVIKDIVNQLENFIERFDQYMILLADYCNAVLKTYRDENERCRGRENPAPKYFANTFSFAEKPILKNNVSQLKELITKAKPTIENLRKIQEENEKIILNEYKKSRKEFDEIDEFK